MACLLNRKKDDCMCGITSEINVLQNIKDDSPLSQEYTFVRKEYFAKYNFSMTLIWTFYKIYVRKLGVSKSFFLVPSYRFRAHKQM